MKQMIVFIAHPVKGDIDGNLVRVRKVLRWINLNIPNVVPIANYVVELSVLNDQVEDERQRGLENGLAIIEKCDELWIFGTDNAVLASSGVERERKVAWELNIPVRHFSEALYHLILRDTELPDA